MHLIQAIHIHVTGRGSGKIHLLCTWQYFKKYHFKIFCRLKQAAGCGWPIGIGSNKHSNLLTLTYVANLVNGCCTEAPYRHFGVAVATGVATRLLPCRGDVYGAMAAVSGHGSPTGTLHRRYILLTMTSQGWKNAPQKSKPVDIGQ